MTFNLRNAATMLAVAVMLSGCMSTMAEEPDPEAQKAMENVRFLPASQVKSCTFVTQTNLTQENSFFGAETTEAYAQAKLRRRAVRAGANAVVITDRILDKGRGGYDKTRISYFANLHSC